MGTIVYLGHASFLIKSNKFDIVLDPYMIDSVPGLRFPKGIAADKVFCSHDHFDHCASNLVGIKQNPNTVEVVDEDEVDLEKINIGCMVKILDIEYDEELEYKIVGSTEANSLKGKISNESPLGKVLIGAKVGDVLTVEAQAGAIQYKVLEIQRSH